MNRAVLAEPLVRVCVALCAATRDLGVCERRDGKLTEAGVACEILVVQGRGGGRPVVSDGLLDFVDFELLERTDVLRSCACDLGVCGELVEVGACAAEHLESREIQEGEEVYVQLAWEVHERWACRVVLRLSTGRVCLLLRSHDASTWGRLDTHPLRIVLSPLTQTMTRGFETAIESSGIAIWRLVQGHLLGLCRADVFVDMLPLSDVTPFPIRVDVPMDDINPCHRGEPLFFCMGEGRVYRSFHALSINFPSK